MPRSNEPTRGPLLDAVQNYAIIGKDQVDTIRYRAHAIKVIGNHALSLAYSVSEAIMTDGRLLNPASDLRVVLKVERWSDGRQDPVVTMYELVKARRIKVDECLEQLKNLQLLVNGLQSGYAGGSQVHASLLARFEEIARIMKEVG